MFIIIKMAPKIEIRETQEAKVKSKVDLRKGLINIFPILLLHLVMFSDKNGLIKWEFEKINNKSRINGRSTKKFD